MKKLVSIFLTGLMAFSAVSVGAVSASAATPEDEPAALAFSAGSDIVFDNSETKWTDVYLYSWGMGYFGDFVKMDATGSDNYYTAVAPVDVAAGTECFLFTNTTDWSGKQTPNIVTEAGKNTYKPIVSATTGAITSVEQSFTASSTAPKVVATPNSKSFSGSLEVKLYAFNTTNAKYKVNDGSAQPLNGSETLTLTATTKIDLLVNDAVVDTYNYDCVTVQNAVINVSAPGYTGDIYVYTFGGDRVGADFNLMTYDEDEEMYTYEINGSAQVIFTTTNDWATATKFIISDASGVLANQEPLVSSGTTVNYTLTLVA